MEVGQFEFEVLWATGTSSSVSKTNVGPVLHVPRCHILCWRHFCWQISLRLNLKVHRLFLSTSFVCKSYLYIALMPVIWVFETWKSFPAMPSNNKAWSFLWGGWCCFDNFFMPPIYQKIFLVSPPWWFGCNRWRFSTFLGRFCMVCHFNLV